MAMVFNWTGGAFQSGTIQVESASLPATRVAVGRPGWLAGLPIAVEETVIRGDPRRASFAVFHIDPERRIQAVEAVNAPADFMAGRLLVAKQARVPPAVLRDPTQPLRELTA